MPKIRRWFPVSHDINRDPEIWEMRDQLGDRAFVVWLELLSIADRNDGAIPGDPDSLPALLASLCRTSRVKAQLVLSWCAAKGWLERSEHLRVSKYWKYHRTEERNKFPPDPTYPDPTEPDRRTDKNQSQISASPGVSNPEKKKGEKDMGTSMNLSPELKEQTDRLYSFDPVKFRRIAAWVAQGRKHGYSEPVMAEALRQFWDWRAVDDWYPYLDTILTKVDKDRNKAASDLEHEQHKAEVREASKMFVVK